MEHRVLLNLIKPVAQEREVAAGTKVLEQGALPEEVMFVADGEVELSCRACPRCCSADAAPARRWEPSGHSPARPRPAMW
jgi:hypothetical protein